MPPSPTGSNREAAFHRSTWQKLHGGELRFNDSASVRVSRTTRGVQFRAKRPAGNISLPELMEVIEFHFDYLVCRPEGAPTDGTGDVNVALQPELRGPVSPATTKTETVRTEAWTYSDYDAANQKRTATNGVVTLTEYITPTFICRDGETPGDQIPVWRFKKTGVTVDDVALKLMAITGREWAEEVQT